MKKLWFPSLSSLFVAYSYRRRGGVASKELHHTLTPVSTVVFGENRSRLFGDYRGIIGDRQENVKARERQTEARRIMITIRNMLICLNILYVTQFGYINLGQEKHCVDSYIVRIEPVDGEMCTTGNFLKIYSLYTSWLKKQEKNFVHIIEKWKTMSGLPSVLGGGKKWAQYSSNVV